MTAPELTHPCPRCKNVRVFHAPHTLRRAIKTNSLCVTCRTAVDCEKKRAATKKRKAEEKARYGQDETYEQIKERIRHRTKMLLFGYDDGSP